MAKKNQKSKRIIGKPKKTIKASGRQGLSLQPGILQQALALYQAGRLAEAEKLYRQLLLSELAPPHSRPDYAQAYFNLANIFFGQHKLDEAVACYRKALLLKPDYAAAHNNLGVTLHDQGKLAEAVDCYLRTLTLQPGSMQVHYNLGLTLKDLGKLDEAVANFRQVLRLKADYAEAHYNLGVILNEQGKYEESAACYRRTLTLKPDFAEAHNNLGIILNDQGQLAESVACYRRALRLKPDYTEAHSNLLMCLNYHPSQSFFAYLKEARHFGRKATEKVSKRFSAWSCAAQPERLCIGLVSGDFVNHPVGYFLEKMLPHIDSSQIDLIAYPTHDNEDELTARIRPSFVAWKPLWGLDDEAAANLIHNDGVHILLDLSGHTHKNRLSVFAWKPAPVQVTWLGYFASTGLAEIDYLLADPISVPESHQEQFTEKVKYLPETRFCFSPPVINEDLPVKTLPALRNGYITFGCFQSLSKINDEVLSAWSRIFQLMPQARLRLQNRQLNSPLMREQFRQRLAQKGIAPEQVMLEKSGPRVEYLAAHAVIDIILDTFPFNGGTTTCEALWMGVPTVTLAGKAMVGRQGASLLSCAGLADWIALNDEDYVVKALAHGTDLEELTRLRAGLRRQLLASPLCNGRQFARHFEALMWEMWRHFEARP